MLTSCSPKKLTTEGRAIVHHPFLLSLMFCLQNSSGTFSASLKQVSTFRNSLFQSWVLHKRLIDINIKIKLPTVIWEQKFNNEAPIRRLKDLGVSSGAVSLFRFILKMN
jgi:lambda repressor-like predicted transcriptional regulator